MREHDRHRHQLVGLVGRVAEHHALVAGAAGVHAHARCRATAGRSCSSPRRCCCRSRSRRRCSRCAAIVARTMSGRSTYVVRRDLAGDDGEAGRDERLARDARRRDPRRGWRRARRPRSASATLSGCPSVTDSDVKRWRSYTVVPHWGSERKKEGPTPCCRALDRRGRSIVKKATQRVPGNPS